MGENQRPVATGKETARRTPSQKQSDDAKCNRLLAQYGHRMERFAGAIRSVAKCLRSFRSWTRQGVWEKIFAALIEQDLVDETTLMIDSTTMKVHQHASGVKKGSITKKQDVPEAD